jgi:hypothetical protein
VRAVVISRFGGPEVLELRELPDELALDVSVLEQLVCFRDLLEWKHRADDRPELPGFDRRAQFVEGCGPRGRARLRARA